jgi:hypothetical protein
MKWRVRELDSARFRPDAASPSIAHVMKTTCLIESRADFYAAYLLSVFANRPAWHAAIRQWNVEERQHGAALRLWSELAEPGFDFEKRFDRYTASVDYHRKDGTSVRGSVERELVARCVVEALASGFYRALSDASSEPLLNEICERLASDEARHYGMFFRFFRETQRERKTPWALRAWTILRRALELGDEQIIYASHVTATRGARPFSLMSEKRRYFCRVYPLYRPRHLYYIAGFVFPLLGWPKHGALQRLTSVALWLAVRARLALYRFENRLSAMRAPRV